MLKTIWLVLISLAMAGHSATAATKPITAPGTATTKADPLKTLKRTRDEMRGITWYQHPSTGSLGSSFHLYFGREDSGRLLPVRLLVRYYNDSWLFVKRAWAKADGVQVDVPQESNRIFGWERDNAGGKIWEWSDTALTSSAELSAVRQIANAKSVTVRFEGRQYYDDRKLSAQQLKAMREVWDAYKAAGGTLP